MSTSNVVRRSRGTCLAGLKGVLAGALVVALATSVQGADSWLSVTSKGVAVAQDSSAAIAPRVEADDLGNRGIAVTVETAGLSLDTGTDKSNPFVGVRWPEASISGEIGAPAIPVVRRLFVAPPGLTPRLSVKPGLATVIDLDTFGTGLQLMPVQAPIPKIPGAVEAAPFNYDPDAFAQDDEFPSERAVIEEVGIVRGQRLFSLEIRPVAYNPVAAEVIVWPEMKAQIRFDGRAQPLGTLNPLPGLHRIVLNPSAVPDVARAGRGTGHYVIITASAYEADIAFFASAKDAQGFDVTVWVAPSANGATIKNYIQGLYDGPTPPDYVLLVGDTNTIPSWTGGGEGAPATDLPYVCMDGSSDWYPDIPVGRFSVRSPDHVQAIVDKTLYYQNGPLLDPDYLKRAVFMASEDNYTVSEGTHNWVISNYMDPNEIVSDKLYCHTYNATTQQVRNAFNDGRFFGIYSGHGDTYYWADGPQFTQGDVEGLTNANMYPFVMSYACITGTYTVDECFTETWSRTANNGAVAIYGSSVNSYWTEDDVLEKRHFDAIYDAEDDVVAEVGPVWIDTLVRYRIQMGSGSTTRRYFEMYNLMGDPSMRFPGACSDAGAIQLDGTAYQCSSTATVEVNDCGLNLNDNVIESVDITVESDSEPAGELITLYETDTSSARFVGSIDLSTTNAPGVLLVAELDTVTATYMDADQGGGDPAEVIATAEIDCTQPDVWNVHATDVEPRNATVAFDANEPVRGIVHYGESCEVLNLTAAGGGYAVSASVSLSGLQDNTTYFYSVDAEDVAGNTTTDDNEGLCYSFTTPDIPNQFTEEFDSDDNDLAYTGLLFVPNGSNDFYAGCSEVISELPTDPSIGTPLSFSPSNDDGYALCSLEGGATVSIYGNSYDSFYVGSNGYITFGGSDTDYGESLEDHFANGMPRISALFDDLNPGSGGTVRWEQLSNRAVVTYQNVPEFSSTGSNTFQIEMFFNGTIAISYLSITAADGLAGLSPGTGMDPDYYETDLSAMGDCAPPDCNENGIPDDEDIAGGTSWDANENGIPDECEYDGLLVVPDSYTKVRGEVLSGGLVDLWSSDDSRLEVEVGIVLNATEPPVWVRVEGTAMTASPAQLTFILEAYVDAPGMFSQKIELYNYVTQSYELLDDSGPATSDTVIEVSITDDPSRFIDPITLEMKAQLTWKATGLVAFFPWHAGLDVALWTINP